MTSSAGSLSMASVAGLMASVGSDCHLERTAMAYNLTIATPPISPAPEVDAYLTHLTVERRLARNSVESYARDLQLLAEYAAARRIGINALARTDLEALVRDLMGEGRSPRSVARAVACFRGFYRFLVIDGRLDRQSTRLNYSDLV